MKLFLKVLFAKGFSKDFKTLCFAFAKGFLKSFHLIKFIKSSELLGYMAKKRRKNYRDRIERIIRRNLEEERYREDNSRKVVGIGIIAILMFIAFLLIRPFIISILTAAILSYLFYPLYNRIKAKTEKPNLSALIICLGIVLLTALLIILTTQFAIKELISFYTYIQTHDITAPIKSFFIKISPTGTSTYQITSFFDNIIGRGTLYFFDIASNTIINIPRIMLQMFIIFFVMFYFLIEGHNLIKYSNKILPFKEQIRKRFLERFKVIIRGFVYGTILVGIIQGLFTGIAFYVLGVSQPLMLTMLAILASMIPVLGAWIIWLPIAIGLMIKGSTTAGIGLLIYGAIFISYIDNFLRPVIVGRMVKMSNVIVLLGMLGGIQLFGIIGLVLGPIILDSVIIIIDIYRSKQMNITKE